MQFVQMEPTRVMMTISTVYHLRKYVMDSMIVSMEEMKLTSAEVGNI